MTALPKIPKETARQRHVRLHRFILAAGRMPLATLEGCERQAAMIESGELAPIRSDPSAARANANDRERQAGYSADDVRCWRDEVFHTTRENLRWDAHRRSQERPGDGPLAGPMGPDFSTNPEET